MPDIARSHDSGRIRMEPLAVTTVADMVGRHLEDVTQDPDGLLFTAPRGGPLRYSNTRAAFWDPARVQAGDDLAEITPHDLRHTCASLMRAAGADVKAIQQQLGHRNATVTLNIYTHLFEGDLDEVMDRLDAHFATESRPERVLGEVVDLIHRGKTPGRQGIRWLRGRDSNSQPTD